jgi:hypothetical protein
MSSQARLDGRFERAITFDLIVGSRSNFYWSFRKPFSMEWMSNRYLMWMRSGCAWLDGWFERAITFDSYQTYFSFLRLDSFLILGCMVTRFALVVRFRCSHKIL